MQTIVEKLRAPAADLLRKGDKAFKELGLTGTEPDAVLIEHMAAHPGLMNRPIAILGDRAVLARPPERVLELLD